MRLRGPLITRSGEPILLDGEPHACVFQSGYRASYPHPVVAVMLTDEAGERIMLVRRREDEPAEGGKLALPGGYAEPWQTLVGAAHEEVQQETGRLIIPGTLGYFALLDGPEHLPGRRNETNYNIVHVFTGQAGEQVQEPDDEVAEVLWIETNDLPSPDDMAFGHFDVIGMWDRYRRGPYAGLPLMPSQMEPERLFTPEWWARWSHRYQMAA